MIDKYKKILITGFYLGILFLPKLATAIASTTLNTPEEVFNFLSYDIVYSVIGFIILGVMASLWQHL